MYFDCSRARARARPPLTWTLYDPIDQDENATEYVDPLAEGMVAAEKLEKVHVGDLVREYLEAQELNILNPIGLERAVTNFIEKDK